MAAVVTLKLCKRKKQMQDLREDINPLSTPKRGGHCPLGAGLLHIPFSWQKTIKLLFSISPELCLHVSIRHWWTGSPDFGNGPCGPMLPLYKTGSGQVQRITHLCLPGLCQGKNANLYCRGKALLLSQPLIPRSGS